MKIDSAQIVGQALGLRGPRACPTPTLELE